MRTLVVVFSSVAVLIGLGFSSWQENAESNQDSAKASREISDVMNQMMKGVGPEGSLAKRLSSGTATDEDKMLALDMLIDLVEHDPPRGDATEWKMMSGRAMMAAAKIVTGREGAGEEFSEATNCKACHDKFK